MVSKNFQIKFLSALLTLSTILVSQSAHGFCGFYVAKADASLYNKASQVVYVRNENKNAITMFSDFKGDLKDFALVVPVPEVLKKEQISVGDRSLMERIDAYSAPRLVEYFDSDPCNPIEYRALSLPAAGAARRLKQGSGASAGALGVKIEAKYTVGEYDILILSATDSSGLETWLTSNGYKLPTGASKALQPYIKQDLKFFVAKVNLAEQTKTGFTFLRPIQFAFESPKFMLPIRLGMVNAEGAQDMLVYAITKSGRVETTNYRTVKIPSDLDVPLFVKGKFADFYTATFDNALNKENKKVVLQEYAWNMAWCDPCAADPLKPEELRKLGVFWLGDVGNNLNVRNNRIRPPMPQIGGAVQAFVTRLHVRYDRENFPEDLFFQETSDSSNFQGRYVLHHPYKGTASCPAMETYQTSLKDREAKQVQNLASLTGWSSESIWKQMGKEPGKSTPQKQWYEKIFK